MTAGSRIILIHVGAAVAVYLAERFPLTGLMLMMFGGPYWVSIIANLMLPHIALATLGRRIPIAWLVLPIGAYGAWFGAWWQQRAVAWRQMPSSELSVRVPATMDLVFDANDRFAVPVKEYVVGGRVFAGEYEIQAIRPKPAPPDACFSQVDHAAGETNFGYFRASPDYDLGYCAISRRGPGPHPGLRLHKIQETPFGRDMRTTYALELDTGNGEFPKVGEFSFGWITTMSPWPLFLLGCALNDAGPSWACFAEPLTKRNMFGFDADGQARDWEEAHARSLADLLGRPSRHHPPGFW